MLLVSLTSTATAFLVFKPKEKVSVVEQSSDQPDCVCSAQYDPICGSDGHTYSNQCVMGCAGKDTTVAHRGACRPGDNPVPVPSVQFPCTCVRNYRPVCGNDRQTYANECLLKCSPSKTTVAHTGTCGQKPEDSKPECSCDSSHSPVCGSDGVTYNNECLLRCAGWQLAVANYGPCNQEVSTETPKCTCESKYEPVCGSNGKTYENDCLLRCDSWQIAVQHQGPCEQVKVVDVADVPPKTSCACGRNLRPVCGQNGKTYGNACLLRCNNQKLGFNGPCEGEILRVGQ